MSDHGDNIIPLRGSHFGVKSGSSAGDGGSGMEARIAKLEATVEHIQTDIRDIKVDLRGLRDAGQTDFRITWGAMLAGALGLAALMAHGFHWI